jgi:hypothetical protein
VVAPRTAGHGSLPRDDNPFLHLARAIVRLSDAEQPVHLNSTTRAYFREKIAKLPDYAWLAPTIPRLENAATSSQAANEIGARDPELGRCCASQCRPPC